MTAARKVGAAKKLIGVAEKRQQLIRDFREDFDTFGYRFNILFLR